MLTRTKSIGDLFKEVINTGLCTLCGACLGSCPYMVFYGGKIRMLDFCTRDEGHCYEYCPRTYTEMDSISNKIHGVPYSADEIGTVKEVFMARSKDREIRANAQYGGTVSTLLMLAMQDRVIDAAIMSKTTEEKLPSGYVAHSAGNVLDGAGSNYIAYPALEALNRMPRDNRDRLGIVVTPCQAIALAKMRANPPEQRLEMDNLSMTIGLFCTWALAYDSFIEFLKNNVDLPKVKKFDIPPPPANRFDVYIGKDIKSFSLDEVRKHRMQTCAYCLDMTAEFTDISVGSVEGVDGWNTVIVRTQKGAGIIAAAKQKGKLEIKELPAQSLKHLKEAAMLKKARAIREIVNKTGDKSNLLYLGMSRGLMDELLTS